MARTRRAADEPRLPAEAERLRALDGRWRVEGTTVSEGRTMGFKGRYRFHEVADGWGRTATLEARLEDRSRYEQADIIAFDPSDGMVHDFYVASNGTARERRGRWLDDGTLSMAWEGAFEGKRSREEVTLNVRDRRHVDVHGEWTLDGRPSATTDMRLWR